MEKIKWCLCIKNGIELIEPNETLIKAYLGKSESALKAAASLGDNKDWRISSSYYAMYFALYSILMKIGIKCENHSCTIEFMKEFLKNYFSTKDAVLLQKSMEARVDTQYYIDRPVDGKQYQAMITVAPKFLAKCKEVLFKISENEVNSIRNKVTQLIKQVEREEGELKESKD